MNNIKWTNYIAYSLNSPLNTNHVPSEKIIEYIHKIPPKKELYYGYWDMEERESFEKYNGLLKPAMDLIHIDFDSNDNGNQALNDTKKFIEFLKKDQIEFLIFYSGNKGFHVAFHKSAIEITHGPKEEMESKLKTLLINLKKEFPSIDTAIFNANRKFRAYKSFNIKGQKYKIILEEKDLTSIENIAILAKHQPTQQLKPLSQIKTSPWLLSHLKKEDTTTYLAHSHGETPDNDDSWTFRNEKNKLCIKEMLQRNLPQFNRHDIGMRIINDCWQIGLTIQETKNIVLKWANKTFENEEQRIKDTIRMVDDCYKENRYRYGCYDEIKKTYCSAKCKTYKFLDPAKRAHTLDATKEQIKENTNYNIEKLSEGQIADAIIKELPEIYKFGGKYFRWINTHYEAIDSTKFEDLLAKAAIKAYNNLANIRQIKNLVDHIITKIPVAPENNHFFVNSPNMFNFQDGTCVVETNENGEIKLSMKKHDKNDFLGYCAPFPLFGEHKLPKNGEFLHYIQAKKETMDEESFAAFCEMFGAALIPFMPRIFILTGETNSGKSTAAILIMKLLGGERNVANVIPSSSYIFEWSEAIGKIANIVTELEAKDPIKDARLKEIRDKIPVLIHRKNKEGIRATLPFLHIFCCNEIPPSLEGNTGALNQRITILKFKQSYLNGLGNIGNMAEWLWKQDAGNILEFARQGLARLIDNKFQYTQPKTSMEALEEWQDETDSVKLFIKDIIDGEFNIENNFILKNGAILSSGFNKAYRNWAIENGYKPLSKGRFFQKLLRHGVKKGQRTKHGMTFIPFWEVKAQF